MILLLSTPNINVVIAIFGPRFDTESLSRLYVHIQYIQCSVYDYETEKKHCHMGDGDV